MKLNKKVLTLLTLTLLLISCGKEEIEEEVVLDCDCDLVIDVETYIGAEGYRGQFLVKNECSGYEKWWNWVDDKPTIGECMDWDNYLGQ